MMSRFDASKLSGNRNSPRPDKPTVGFRGDRVCRCFYRRRVHCAPQSPQQHLITHDPKIHRNFCPPPVFNGLAAQSAQPFFGNLVAGNSDAGMRSQRSAWMFPFSAFSFPLSALDSLRPESRDLAPVQPLLTRKCQGGSKLLTLR